MEEYLVEYTLRNYIYLDEEVIQGLYNQIYDNIIDEKVLTQNNFKGDIDGEVGTSGIVKSMLDAGVEFNTEYVLQRVNEKQLQLSIEKKTNLLISKISNDKIVKIKDILDEKHPLQESIIFVGKALFTLTALYDQNGLKTDLSGSLITYYNQNPSMILETGSTFNINKYSSYEEYNDDYFDMKEYEDMKYGVIMNLGEKKIRQSIRHLTFHIKFGKKFLFNVFGEMYYNGGIYYLIKPFAIWR